MQTFTIEQLERWIDRHVIDKNGQRLGTAVDVYVDDANGQPEWLAVTTGLFGSRMSFVPIQGAIDQGDKVQVAYEKSLVKDSPNIEADGQLSEEEEERLYRHYGLAYNRHVDGLTKREGAGENDIDLRNGGVTDVTATEAGETRPTKS